MRPDQVRILLLSAGSLSAQNVIDALWDRRDRVVLIGANSIAEAAGTFRCDVARLVPPAADSDAYRAAVMDIIEAERPALVVPTRDDDLEVLAWFAEHGRPPGAALLTGSSAAARLMNDKAATATFAARHGLPFAATATDTDAALAMAGSHGLPLIGKPRGGNGSRGVVLLRSREEIARAFAQSPDLVAQPFLSPSSGFQALLASFEAGLPFFFSVPEAAQYTVQVVIGPDGGFSDPFGCRNVQIGGQAVENRRCRDADLLDLGRAYAAAIAAEGWRGPVNVQLKRVGSGSLVPFEMNGRVTGGTAARTLLGFDEMGEILRRFLPGTDWPPLKTAGVEIVGKYLASYPIPDDSLSALRSAGRWSRNT